MSDEGDRIFERLFGAKTPSNLGGLLPDFADLKMGSDSRIPDALPNVNAPRRILPPPVSAPKRTILPPPPPPQLCNEGSFARKLEMISRIAPQPIVARYPHTAAFDLWGCEQLVRAQIRRTGEINPGRVLPTVDDLAIGSGRELRAAFLYSDLSGFTRLVASCSKTATITLALTFFDLMDGIGSHYGGRMVDCAGDRALIVFYRPSTSVSCEPIHDAVTAALWMQTVVQRILNPLFTQLGVPDVAISVGVDYGEAVAGCIGSPGSKRLIFIGDAANNAAKLQDTGKANETVLSPIAYSCRPQYMKTSGFSFRREAIPIERWIFSGSFAYDVHFPPARER